MAKPPVEVVIRHATDLEEVIVVAPETATLRELKELLAAQLPERPELMEVGEILRMLPDGSTGPMKETMKIGIKRLFGFQGCPLHPPEDLPPPPPPTLECFAEFDPNEEVIASPRSVQACNLEGIAPEDLLYVPPEAFRGRSVEPRIAELWYDFFEALRQDSIRAARLTRKRLIAEEEGRAVTPSANGSRQNLPGIEHRDSSRIAGTGGNWTGALQHSDNGLVAKFFMERNEMCNIDRVYRGATKPFRPDLKGSRYFSQSAVFNDEDPVLAGDTADDAAGKLDDLLLYYKRIPHSKKFVEEQRLKTEATGVGQYSMDAKKLRKDQSEERRLAKHRNETAEVQISIADGEIQERNKMRAEMDERNLASKPPSSKLEILRMDAIQQRAEYFQKKRSDVHEMQLDYEYWRCDELDRLTLRDHAVQERVHRHRSLTSLGFAREWTKRRIRWQLNNNSVTANRNAWNQATLDKQQAAADRVDTQHLIRQKWIEYKREIRTLKRLYAEMKKRREEARHDARREAVATEFLRLSAEEAHPSPCPMRRSKTLASTASSDRSAASQEISGPKPYSHLLKQPRVVKRIARFDFPRCGSGFLASSPTASTRSGPMSTFRTSSSMPSIGGSTERELQKALTLS